MVKTQSNGHVRTLADPPKPEFEFDTREVQALTGATPRQLQWWDEQDFVFPRRRGHTRVWDSNDLREVRLILQARRCMGWKLISHALAQYRKIARKPGSFRFVLTDGYEVHALYREYDLIRYMRQMTRPAILIDLDVTPKEKKKTRSAGV